VFVPALRAVSSVAASSLRSLRTGIALVSGGNIERGEPVRLTAGRTGPIPRIPRGRGAERRLATGIGEPDSVDQILLGVVEVIFLVAEDILLWLFVRVLAIVWEENHVEVLS
jgi:hypothetical protein